MSRSQLMSLLSEACELEHALACSYLVAAFSLNQGPGDGLAWEQQQLTRRWAGQLYFVASQEMLHLAQAWNLLNAIGGEPYFFRAAFPHKSDYFSDPAELTLEKFSAATIDRFIKWETPRESAPSSNTVGALYDQIGRLIDAVDERELFVGDPDLQVDRGLADFPDLIPVRDRRSAHHAIASIQRQGQGREVNHDDGHWGMFRGVRAELDSLVFEPARDVISNPHAETCGSAGPAVALFDDLCAWMIRMLAWVFGPADPRWPETKRLARTAILAMPLVIKPFGEALTTLSAAKGRAGAAFDLRRHVRLPASSTVALQLSRERLAELGAVARTLSLGSWLPKQLDRLAASLG